MNLSTDQLLSLLGEKEVEIFLLKQMVAKLEAALKDLAPKQGSRPPNETTA